ncbi:uncharacterized protein LOC116806334 isoform X7 [Drosophila grimshawi]|uniref:uncharacterized protein LOC116806334 isoform X7 n=1 Tax=Drosophila grimshawi TaxID=7222 RepID=UPI001C935B1E|nr:uncharacterized protein LOC116806334 isoform X7 [Drosophila grimshawi]
MLPRTRQHQRRIQRRASLDVKSRIRSQPWMNRLPRTAGQHQRRTQRRASLDVKSRIRSQPWMNSSRSTRRTYHDAGTEHQRSRNSRSASGAVRSAASYRSRRVGRQQRSHCK